MRLGKRATLIDWLCIAGVTAVFCVILYRGLVWKYTAEGIPDWAKAFYGWQEGHMPRWWIGFLRGLGRTLER